MNKTHPVITALVLFLLDGSANAQFNDNTQVLQRWSGLGSFGWALSTLQDINNDGVTEIMVTSIGSASVVVYSGADGAELHRFTRPGSQLGYAIADAGDINGDGINDVLAGAVLEPGGGAAFVFSGADASTLLTLNGENAGDQFGYAVSSAGDVNSDGVPDILVGASQNDNQGAQSGRAYVYSGADGNLVRRYEAESAGDRFGGGTALLDDLDNDGIPEHIIGAFAAGNGGRAYVFSGASGNLLFTLNPDQGAVNFGQFFVADLGDVDGDGTGDIYVGDFNHAGGAGRVYVFSGADQSVLHRFSGGPGEGAGPGRSAGDVDNDGFADIIVGNYTSSVGGLGAGRTFVYSGADGSILQSFTHTIANSQLGFDAIGMGDTNGDGRFDFAVSAANGNIAYILEGTVDRLQDNLVNINPGMNGAWFNSATPGQGVMIDVLPQTGIVFAAWFTHETVPDSSGMTATLGDINHRWLTAQGPFAGDTASLDVFLTSGGLFDMTTAVSSVNSGSVTLRFTDCENAEMDYNLPDAGLTGTIPLIRIANDNSALCQSLSDGSSR